MGVEIIAQGGLESPPGIPPGLVALGRHGADKSGTGRRIAGSGQSDGGHPEEVTRTGVIVTIEASLHCLSAAGQRLGELSGGDGQVQDESVEEMFDQVLAR